MSEGQQPQHVMCMGQLYALVMLAQVGGCPPVVCEELLTLPRFMCPQVMNEPPHAGSQVILPLLLEQLDQGLFYQLPRVLTHHLDGD